MAKSDRYFCRLVVRNLGDISPETTNYFRVFDGTGWVIDPVKNSEAIDYRVGSKMFHLTIHLRPEIGVIYERGILVSDKEETGTYITFEEGQRFQKIKTTRDKWQEHLPKFLGLV
jgi:hypothetical protein